MAQRSQEALEKAYPTEQGWAKEPIMDGGVSAGMRAGRVNGMACAAARVRACWHAGCWVSLAEEGRCRGSKPLCFNLAHHPPSAQPPAHLQLNAGLDEMEKDLRDRLKEAVDNLKEMQQQGAS